MQPFTVHRGTTAVVEGDNLDTDRIIPARFLSRVDRSGYGELLFVDARQEGVGTLDPRAKGASVLVVGTNFGCGSSREHAVWAIQQAGFRAVVARRDAESPGFSDIFRQNAANCGLLLIELDASDHALVAGPAPGTPLTIDLDQEALEIGGRKIEFKVDPGTRAALLEGLDLIGSTSRHDSAIAAFEKGRPAW